MTDKTLSDYQTELGDTRVAALHKGGEDLLDKIEGALGPARRHCDRIKKGTFDLNQVEREIIRSINHAKNLINEWKDKEDHGR